LERIAELCFDQRGLPGTERVECAEEESAVEQLAVERFVEERDAGHDGFGQSVDGRGVEQGALGGVETDHPHSGVGDEEENDGGCDGEAEEREHVLAILHGPAEHGDERERKIYGPHRVVETDEGIRDDHDGERQDEAQPAVGNAGACEEGHAADRGEVIGVRKNAVERCQENGYRYKDETRCENVFHTSGTGCTKVSVFVKFRVG